MATDATIYDALKKDHRALQELLDRLVRFSENDHDDWKSVVDQIRDEVIPHARAEEALFYNAIRELDSDNDVVGHSYVEHAMGEADLRALQAMKAIDVNWTKLAQKLRADLLHHIEEEESKVFAAAQALFTEEEAVMIGEAFERLKPEVREEGLVGTSMDLVLNMLPRRVASVFQKKDRQPTIGRSPGA